MAFQVTDRVAKLALAYISIGANRRSSRYFMLFTFCFLLFLFKKRVLWGRIEAI